MVWVDDQRLPLGQGVRDEPAEQAQDQHRQELHRRDSRPSTNGSSVSWRTSHAWATCLHPGADERDELAAEEQPVVAVAERARRRSRSERRRLIGARSRSSWQAAPPMRCAWCGLAARRRGPRGAPARCARRAAASAIIASRRSLLRSSVRDLAVDAAEGVDERSAAAPRGRAARNRTRLRSRACSSSSSWPISARENPASSRSAADEPQAVEIVGVVQAVRALGAGGGREQPHLLVVADGARRQAGLGGDLLDAEEPGRVVRGGGIVTHVCRHRTLTLTCT